MKKLVLSCAVAITAAMSFSSCTKNTCYTCELSASSISTDICDDKITVTTNGTAAASTDIPGGVSVEDYKKTLELAGYTCTAK
ncbi:hypothetical protein [Aureispira anguillae]|uniref:HMA domain-containing protein n=1 Tax=Aureispira anguillae TaxID=2864201 RepID=A0A915YGB7_9BACT|nr:hypothetical protein [Aureispira anguillae]BDS12510.1 hypothetical protein AsAng_0032330 [Aureispira anguillae]